jgi:hypothetical protein
MVKAIAYSVLFPLILADLTISFSDILYSSYFSVVQPLLTFDI